MTFIQKKELAAYEEVAPSRYLRVFASLTVLVKDRGDNFDDEKGSSFVRGVTSINKELNDEILYRSKLSYALRSISALALIPIFLALPTKKLVYLTISYNGIFFMAQELDF
ncbi:hypothetical protein OL548_34450 (plasmid) [Lysinibacillus sp. MHQ-1]|nr:hypothetical protein OL548_34450 [Lysinibacillus sp. MHQ-1]